MDQLQYYSVIGQPLKGGMGQVLHLHHDLWNKDLAMKQPKEDRFKTERDRAAFINECERWISLGIHPHIVQCYIVCDINGMPSALMEWADGGSLKSMINSRDLYKGDLETALLRILNYALQMAQGLYYAHKNGVLHLDVKPDNALIDKDGVLKISDFGMSILIGPNSKGLGYTYKYAAPEQLKNEHPDERTDVFCWAVSVLEVLVPMIDWMYGKDAAHEFRNIIRYSLFDIPPRLSDLLEYCMQYYQEDRPKDFGYVIKELILIYNSLSDVPYVDEYADYDGSSLGARSNIAISQYFLGNAKNARDIWLLNTYKNPYHFTSYYNYNLYLRRFEDGHNIDFRDLGFCESEKMDKALQQVNKDILDQLLYKSKWQYSVGAYASAYAYARKAKKGSEKLFGPSNDIYHNNFNFMSNAMIKYGPVVMDQLDLKNALKIDGKVCDDCVLLAYAYNDNILYLGKNGKIRLIDRRDFKIVGLQTGFENAQCAAISRDGRYLAMGKYKDNYFVPYTISVIDLVERRAVLSVSGKTLPTGLKYLTFVQQKNARPRLIASTGWYARDWEIPDTPRALNDDVNSVCRYEAIMGENSPITCLAEDAKGRLIAKSDRAMRVYDGDSLEMLKSSMCLDYYQLQKYQIQPVPNKQYAIFLDEAGGYVVFDYLKHRFITQESFGLNGEEPICQLSVNRKGDRMVVLCGDTMQIRSLPDYDNLRDPIWMVEPFKTTSEFLDEYRSICTMAQTLDGTLTQLKMKKITLSQVSYNAMALKLKNIRDYYRGSVKPIYPYLALASKMARVYGFRQLEIRGIYTNEDISFIPLSDSGEFIEADGTKLLGMQRNGIYLHLLSLADRRIIKEDICDVSNLLGLSKDYCYLVLKPGSGWNYKYCLISLEWVFNLNL